MQLGKGIKEPAAEQLVGKVKQELLEGEVVVFVCKCNNFKPMVDRLLLTSTRLLALSAADAKIGFAAGCDEVVDVVVESGWTGTTLAITKSDASHTVFKSMDQADAEALRASLRPATSGDQRPPATATAEREVSNGDADPDDADQPGELAEAGAAIRTAYNNSQEVRAQLAESNAGDL